jgi:hypothetical protein
MPNCRVLFGVLVALALADQACGTQPCFRHSDCASSEVCSSGSCVPAPVDGGSDDVSSDAPVTPVDTGTPPPGPDAFEAGEASVEAEAGEAASDASDAGDAGDAYGERDAVNTDSAPE